MSARPLSPANLIPAALTAGCVVILRLFYEQLAEMPVVRAILYFSIAAGTIQMTDAWLIRPVVRKIGMPRLFETIIKIILSFTVIFTMLKMLYDIDLMPLLTTSAVLSFVLGLALQDTLGNFFAGITINIEHPYRVGDWINSNGVDGKVVEVTWRTTKLLTNDNNFLIIPNNNISKETITNYSAPERVSALWVDVDLEYSVPPNKARSVILEALAQLPGLPTVKAPDIQLRAFSESSITYGVRLWLDDWSQKNALASEVRVQVWYALNRAGMSIPFPIRTVIMQKQEEASLSEKQGTLGLLRASSLFMHLEENTLGALAESAVEHLYAAGSQIFKEGDAGSSLFIVKQGKLGVLKQNHRVAELGEGALFGEMSLLTGETRSASILALVDTVCVELNKDSFAPIAARSPQLIEQLGEMMAQRQLSTKAALENAQKQTGKSQLEIHAVLKDKLVSMMRSFLNLGSRA